MSTLKENNYFTLNYDRNKIILILGALGNQYSYNSKPERNPQKSICRCSKKIESPIYFKQMSYTKETTKIGTDPFYSEDQVTEWENWGIWGGRK